MSLVEIPDPPGYKVVQFGTPLKGHFYLSGDGTVCVASRDYTTHCYLILEPVELWRDATIDDLKRAPCRARFRDNDMQWIDGTLIGWQKIVNRMYWKRSECQAWYLQCQAVEQPK